MDNISIKVVDLLEKLKANRKKHQKEIEELETSYREAVIDCMSTRLRNIKDGGDINVFFSIPKPENHIKDYDIAIDMLGYETRKEIEISRHEFEQYVLDEWSWAQGLNATKTYYAGLNKF